MQAIKFRYAVAHAFDAPAEAVAGFFGDPMALAQCTPHVVSACPVDARTVDYVLETQRDLGLVFTPRYRLQYAFETPRTLLWRSVPSAEGNVEIEARVQFIEQPLQATNVTQVAVEERVSFPLPVTLITAKIVEVIARRQSANDMSQLLAAAERALALRLTPVEGS